MPRFALLQHTTLANDRDGSHYDLLLEHEGQLLTWSIKEPPTPGLIIAATRLPVHRLLYLDYEGPISGDRGEVKRIDGGRLQWLAQEKQHVAVLTVGASLRLHIDLNQQAGDQWTLCVTAS